MDRKEIDQETKATKNTRNLWRGIVSLGIILMLAAIIGGFFNHNESLTPGSDTVPGTVLSDTIKGDMVDTLPAEVQ